MADPSVAAPVQVRARLQHLDVIRGVALFGILLMNITMFGMPKAYTDPTVWGGATGADLWACVTTNMLFEGTQRGLFSILFGAGLMLLTSRLDASGRKDTADIFYRRNLWLVVFGVIHSYLLLWTGEILFYYGCTALFLYALRNLSPRSMVTMAVAGLIVAALWNGFDSYSASEKWRKASAAQAVTVAGGALSDDQKDDLDAWKAIEGEMKPDQRKLNKDLEAHRGSYLDVVLFQAPLNARRPPESD